ncbi:hypothetical protein D3C83_243850 [compost metagenome]
MKTSAAAMTGRGMIAKSIASCGRNPRATKISATAHATRRLATPVAPAIATLAAEVLVP